MVPDSEYRVKLRVFEGPLDLLLFLIRKNELDICDIPIESVTRQYIEVLHGMQELDLEVAGEFFVMAATLMEIKSRMLLPKGEQAVGPDDDDADMDPRWELVQQLLEYKKFKDAASSLRNLITERQDLLDRQVADRRGDNAARPLQPVGRLDLWNTFNIVLRRLAEKLIVGEIRDEQVTVADRMEDLLARMRTEKQFYFSALFTGRISLRFMVATFLAILELTRLKRLSLSQDEVFADIACTVIEEQIPLETPDNPRTVTA